MTFIKGHTPWNKNKKLSESTKEKMRGSRPNACGENHRLWKGENVGRQALHSWVKRHLGKPKKCEFCSTTTAKNYDWANKSGEYKRDFSDFLRLCRSCHKKYDVDRLGLVAWNKGLKGYNAGEKHPQYGKKRSKKTRDKISKAVKGKNLGNQHAKGHVPWNKGMTYKMSDIMNHVNKHKKHLLDERDSPID